MHLSSSFIDLVNSSFAFTARTKYSCLNDDRIEVASSLIPS